MEELLFKLAQLALREFSLPTIFGSTQSITPSQIYVPRKLALTGRPTIAEDKAFSNSKQLVLVGEPGAGKTTILRHQAARAAKLFIDNPAVNPSPLFLPARHLPTRASTSFDASLLSEFQRLEIDQLALSDLISLLDRGRIAIFLDGLDELPPSEAEQTVSKIASFIDKSKRTSIAVSTRPTALLRYFEKLPGYQIQDLTVNEVRQLVRRIASPEGAASFLHHLSSVGAAAAPLMKTPLLALIMWDIFQRHKTLAPSRTALFSDAIHGILSREEQKKSARRSTLTFEQLEIVLQALAAHSLGNDTLEMDSHDLFQVIQKLNDAGYDIPTADTINELIYNPIFYEAAQHRFHFIHKSLQEFLAARAIQYDPTLALTLLRGRVTPEILSFIDEMIQDVTQLVDACIGLKHFHLINLFISNKSISVGLRMRIRTAFADEFGAVLMSILSSDQPAASAPQPQSAKHQSLLASLEASIQASLSKSDRGARFEEFATEFFGDVFKVVSRNLHTENGEMDLVLEIVGAGLFWADFGCDALVECKNWMSKRPLREVGTFAYKASKSRVKLAFFVSVSGFTQDAIRTLRNNASDKGAALVVPLSGADIRNALTDAMPIEEFFKREIRNIKYLRKF